MTMMDFALLQRRREINRRAARKSRTRQKEMATQIRKKYYEVQSTNTKLIYERNQLRRERDRLKAELLGLTNSCLDQFDDLLDQDPPNRPTAGRSLSHQDAVVSLSFSRSASCPASSRQGEQEEEDGIEDTSSDEEASPPMSEMSSAELDIVNAMIDSNASTTGCVGLSDLSQNPDRSGETSMSMQSYYDNFSELIADDNFSLELFDELAPFESIQIFSDSTTASVESQRDVLTTSLSEYDVNRGTASNSGDPSGTIDDLIPYCEAGQQLEAIDLSTHRRPSLNTPLPVSRTTSVGRKPSPRTPLLSGGGTLPTEDNRRKVSEFSLSGEVAGNIPLHVQAFIVGEK